MDNPLQNALKKQIFKYWGFGLKILSEIEFPELLPFLFEVADVTINLGTVAPLQNKNVKKNATFNYILQDNTASFFVNDSANYFVKDGATITVDPMPGVSDIRYIQLFTLSLPIAAILWQRSLVLLHSSAIVHNGGLVCITGHSGAGKSTSVAGLSKRGYQIFSDDVVVVNSSLAANAAHPTVKLWEDAQQKLNDDIFADRSFAISHGRNKFGIFFHEGFDTNSYSIKKVFVLKKGDVSSIKTVQMANASAFLALRKQVFRDFLIRTNELQAVVFHAVSKLVNSARVYEITRPDDCDVDELINELERYILI